jgi:uncharacterized protein
VVETLAFNLEGNSSGVTWPIVGDVYVTTSDEATAPVVALAHGWLGHRGRPPVPAIATALAEAGITAVTFNFSGSGVPAGSDDFLEDDKLAANSFAREVDDVERIVTAIFERILPGRERFDIRRIGVLGHDVGGTVAFVEAARDSRVKALASLAAPVRFDQVITSAAFDDGIARGEHIFRDPRTNRRLRLGREFFRDLRARTGVRRAADAPPADALGAAKSLTIPYLVVHGDADKRVPLADARALYFAGLDGPELEVIAGGDHDFECGGAVATAAAVRFFRKRLV